MNGKKYIIFGATGGIGSLLCSELKAKGAELYLVGRSPEKLETQMGELQSQGEVCEALEPSTIEQAVKNGADALGGISGVVNCIGSIFLRSGHLTSQEQWHEVLTTNLTSCFSILRSSVEPLRASGGSLVFISSSAASVGLKNHEAIAAAKAGIEGLVRSAATTYSGVGIRVNAVAPGLVETPATAKITGNESGRKYSEGLHPVGRLGKPEDITSAISFLLDDRQSWLSGQVIRVDGGLANLKA